MLVTKEIVLSFSNKFKSQNIIRIWASDGWCYIPNFGERQKFIARSPELFELVKQKWDGIIPSSEYVENVEYYQITKNSWIEKTIWGCEKFQETTEDSSM
jgi:hypothetical protein